MFISTDYLGMYYGIDDKIARFFVDRDPPVGNLYWKGKLLYLRADPGFLFIPLVVDLLYKMGIDRGQLLSEEFVTTMEAVGHISALEETGQIDAAAAIEQCAELVKDCCKKKDWFDNLLQYFKKVPQNFFGNLATPFAALHRGDYFLFSICSLEFPESLTEKIIRQWFALISTLLLLDDAEDIKSDKETGDDNAFIESGLNAKGLQRIKTMAEKNFDTIGSLNKTMERWLRQQFSEAINMVKFQ